MTSNEDQQLIKNSIAGNRLAQGAIYRKYVESMYNIAVRMVVESTVAKDLTQDVFVKVFESLGKFRGESTLGAWIKRITINTCLNHLRKNEMLQVELSESTLEMAEENDEIIPVDIAMIHQAIKSLPTGCRTVMNLYLLEGYQHSEIAEILNISVSTSKSQYYRSKQLLKEKLKAVYYNED